MKLSIKSIKEYENSGFIIIRDFISIKKCEECLSQIKNYMADQGIKFDWLKEDEKDLNRIILQTMRRGTPQRSFVYDLMRYVPKVRSLVGSDQIIGLLGQLGLCKPVCMENPSVRFDVKGEECFLTKPHQDLRSIRSARCVTVWLPLTKCDEINGSIAAFSGTHNNGVLPYDMLDGQMSVCKKYLNEQRILNVDPGDLVLLNSFCVHESIRNKSSKIKINLQCFYNDLDALNYNDKLYKLNQIKDYKEIM